MNQSHKTRAALASSVGPPGRTSPVFDPAAFGHPVDNVYFPLTPGLVTHLHGNAPQVSVESGRKMVPNEHMPTFLELEEAVQAVQIG